ncbi:MAG: hypothetical protein AB7R89_16265 [Dehalococcoidia bacterium]
MLTISRKGVKLTDPQPLILGSTPKALAAWVVDYFAPPLRRIVPFVGGQFDLTTPETTKDYRGRLVTLGGVVQARNTETGERERWPLDGPAVAVRLIRLDRTRCEVRIWCSPLVASLQDDLLAAMAERWSVPADGTADRRQRGGRPIDTTDRNREILAKHDAGKTRRELASEYGLSYSSIKGILQKMRR